MRRSRRDPHAPDEPKSKWFWASCGIVAALAIALWYVLFVPSPDPIDNRPIAVSPPPAASSTLPTPAPSAQTTPAGSSCSEQGIPATPPDLISPPATSWYLQGSMAVPVSPETGPWSKQSGFNTCYARTPAGALVAVATFIGELAASNVENRPLLVQTRVAREQGYDALLGTVLQAKAAMTHDLPPGASPNDAAKLQISGYRWVDYTPDRVTVEIVYRMTMTEQAGSMASATYTLTWTDNDWKVVYPGQGQIAFESIENLTGYTQWGGA